jgi:TRAP-type C4-dicarboxylate transport system substrate-binding protein
MKFEKKAISILLASVITTASLLSTSAMANTTLVMSSWLPARYPVVINAIKPWADEVANVTDGRVKVRVLAKPMGAPAAHYDMAVDGIADITYGLHSFTTDDRFLGSRIGQFSFIADDAVSGSKAFWDVYTKQLNAVEEHQGVKLLGLFLHGPGLLNNGTRKLEKPEDIEGLKIRTPGGYIADLMSDLGATTLFMSSGEVFAKLSRGVIDGVTFPLEALPGFKLTDYITHSMSVPGGFYNTSWFLVMNKDKWNNISPEDQAAIEAISGAAFAELAGKAWDASDKRSLSAIKEAGIEIYTASPEILEAVKAVAAKYEAQWVKEVAKTGADGAAALADFRAQTGVEH